MTKKISVKEHPSLIPWLPGVWGWPVVLLVEAVVTVEGEEEAVTEEVAMEAETTKATIETVVKPETAAVKSETAVVKPKTTSAGETIVINPEIAAPVKPEAASAFETTAPACSVRRCRRLH